MKQLPFYLLIISNFLLSEELNINCKILSNANEPLQYANITCDENYSVSDKNGYFNIECNKSSKISINFIGFKEYQVNIKDLPKTVTLYPIDILINEVKVYGGLESDNSDTRIKIINKSKYHLNGKETFKDIIQSNSELNFAGGTANPRYIQIRGLGELSQFSGEGAPHFYVGLHLDDINFTGIGGITLLDDINQIEIFKGPQSTGFGSNAMAGAINMISTVPNFIKSYNAKISYSSFNTLKYSLNTNYPFSEKLATNISIIKNESDGYIKNLYLENQNSNSKNELLTKIKFLYTPNENSKHLLTSYYIDLSNKYDTWTVDDNGYSTQSDYQGIDENKTKAISLKSLYDYNEVKVTSITSYSTNNIDYAYDGDWGNNEMWESEPYDWYADNTSAFSPEACDEDDYYHEDTNTQCFYNWSFPDITNRKRELSTQELRFSLKNILLGIYISKLREEDQRTGYFFSGNSDDMKSSFDISNASLYSKYKLNISEKSNIDISFRYDSYKTINDLYHRSSYYPGPYDYQQRTIEDSNIGWNVLLNKKLDNYSNLIFSVSKGYKTSGINQSPNFSENPTYKSEESLNYEIGYSLYKDRIKLKNSIFYMNRNNPQLRLFIQNNTDYPTYFDYATFNGSTSYSYGFETDIIWELSNIITFNSSASILKNHIGAFYFDEDSDGNNEKFGNRTSSHSPKSSISFGTKINLSKQLTLNLDANYKDEFYFDEQNDHKSNSYSLLNASLVYSKDNFSLSLWGKNLSDEKYAIRGYSFVLLPSTTTGYTDTKSDYRSYGAKKSLGITFKYSF